MFKGLAGLGSMLRQAQQIGGRMQEMSEELKTKKLTGSAGGGMVEVDINGLSEIIACRLDETLLNDPDRELIEDLVVSAVNQAIAKAKQLHAESIQEMTGNIELPGLQDALAKFTGGAESENADDAQ